MLFAYNWDLENCPLYGIERWPRSRGFLSTTLIDDAVGTKVSVRHRQGSRLSEVVVKRGSTVRLLRDVCWLYLRMRVLGNYRLTDANGAQSKVCVSKKEYIQWRSHAGAHWGTRSALATGGRAPPVQVRI